MTPYATHWRGPSTIWQLDADAHHRATVERREAMADMLWRGYVGKHGASMPLPFTAPSPHRPAPSQCDARQYSDQMLCGLCGLAWDVNDPEPPQCPKHA